MSNRRVLFRGFKSDIDQIHTIFRLLGTPSPAVWPGLQDVPYWRQTFPDWPARTVASLVPLMSSDGADFVSRILRYDAQSRMTAKSALTHPYLRARAQQPLQGQNQNCAGVNRLTPQHGVFPTPPAHMAGLRHVSQVSLSSQQQAALPVPVFGAGAALASRCSSAVSFRQEDSQLSFASLASHASSSSLQGAAAQRPGIFQPIRSCLDLAGAAAAAPQPVARTVSAGTIASASAPSGSSTAGPVLPRANRPAAAAAVNNAETKPAVVLKASAVNSSSAAPVVANASAGAAFAPIFVAANAAAATAAACTQVGTNGMNAPSGGVDRAVVRGAAQKLSAHQHRSTSSVALPIPAAALTRVQVPVHSIDSIRRSLSMPAMASSQEPPAAPPAQIPRNNTSLALATGAKRPNMRLRPSDSIAVAATAATNMTAVPAATATASRKRPAKVVTEESAADLPLSQPAQAPLQEPPAKAARLRVPSRETSVDSLATAEGGGPLRDRCSSVDSLNAALVTDLDATADSWDAVLTSQDEVQLPAPAGGLKGRVGKKGFGSPLPSSRPPSTVMFSVPLTIPGTAPTAASLPAAVVTAPRSSALSARAGTAGASKYVRVTPDTVLASDLYWAGSSQDNTPFGAASSCLPVLAPAPVAVRAAPAAAKAAPVKAAKAVASKAAAPAKGKDKAVSAAAGAAAEAAPARRSTRRGV
jgi:hypothetical protein